MEAPPHARAGQTGRGHRFAAYPRCWADPRSGASAKSASPKPAGGRDGAGRLATRAGAILARIEMHHDMADLLVKDIERQLPHLQAQPAPVRDASNSSGFHH